MAGNIISSPLIFYLKNISFFSIKQKILGPTGSTVFLSINVVKQSFSEGLSVPV